MPFCTNIQEPEDRFDALLENIEIVKDQGIEVPFRIVDIKKGGFLVKIEGLYGYVPFSRMPWTYPHLQCWDFAFPMLTGKSFMGKVYSIERKKNITEEGAGFIRVYVDATSNLLTKTDLFRNTDYHGVVIRKMLHGAMVDIGCHFNWKCGSLPGILPVSKFPDSESFRLCKPGQIIGVRYLLKKEQGLYFEKDDYIDLHTKYTGKTVSVKVYRRWDGSLHFRVEDRYKAILPVTRSIYGEGKDWIMNTVKDWSDGDIIDCEVLDVKSYTDLFVIKWLPENDFEKNIDKTVRVKVFRDEEGHLDFVANGRYKTEIPLTKAIYGGKILSVKNAMKNWFDGKIINCKVLEADLDTGQYVVKWLPNEELKSYIGKLVRGKICISGDGYRIFVEDKYYAKMPVTRAIYGGGKMQSLVKNALKNDCVEDKIIHSNFEVLDVDPYEQFVVKWLPNKKLRAYIGKTVEVEVGINERGVLDFLVENKYKAELPLKRSVYGKLDLVKEKMKSWTNNEIIDCIVLDVEPYTDLFIVRWMSKILDKIEYLPKMELPDIKLKVVGKINLDEMNHRFNSKKKTK